MKHILKIIGIVLGIAILGVVVFGWIKSEPLPQGQLGSKADALANKMLKALNDKAYQNTRFLEWSYRNGANQYKWDKTLGICIVEWKDYKAVLHLTNMDKSTAAINNEILEADEAITILNKAIGMFNNDSFWLVAPYKVFDKGTTRSLVTLSDGSQGLLITYTTGGTTPGDSYLWKLNANGFPEAYQMWVKIIPIGGLEASWDDWIVTESGAFLPKSHQLGPLTLSMGDVKGYNISNQ